MNKNGIVFRMFIWNYPGRFLKPVKITEANKQSKHPNAPLSRNPKSCPGSLPYTVSIANKANPNVWPTFIEK